MEGLGPSWEWIHETLARPESSVTTQDNAITLRVNGYATAGMTLVLPADVEKDVDRKLVAGKPSRMFWTPPNLGEEWGKPWVPDERRGPGEG